MILMTFHLLTYLRAAINDWFNGTRMNDAVLFFLVADIGQKYNKTNKWKRHCP